MNDPQTQNALQNNSTALRRQRNPTARPSKTTAATKAFRLPIFLDQLTIDPVPTDAQGTPLPFVVLLDLDREIDVVTWPDVRVDNTRKLPPNTNIAVMLLIATRSEADWKLVRPAVLLGDDNGEPGTASNGGGH